MIYFALLDYKEKLEPIFHIIENIADLNCVFYKDNYSPDLWYMEIYSRFASKFHAVNFLRDFLKLDQVICFGDNRNDFPLFEASDYKIAVGNAVTELKEKADLIIGNNYDDGVSAWLKQNY
jgi:hydroxymethylpyrimidine pyrophosphatase-like HAD family hydrolase